MRAALSWLGLVLVAVLAAVLARVPGERQPQLLRGGDGPLAVAFADARSTLSRALVHKADSYFHGGVGMPDDDDDHDECDECRRESGHAEGDTHAEGECHCGESGHEHDHGAASGRPEASPLCSQAEECEHAAQRRQRRAHVDPWRWINAHIGAPQQHTHLDGKKAVELVPWFWASVKADPHNIEAWDTAWYIAWAEVKDREMAERIITEGVERNPDSVALRFTLGRHYYQRGEGDVERGERAFKEALNLALKLGGGDLGKLNKRDGDDVAGALMYLARIANDRGDRASVIAYRDAAARLNPRRRWADEAFETFLADR